MKIEIEKKITITPDGEGEEPIIAFSDILSSESKDTSTVMDMINVGTEQMEVKANKSLLTKLNELQKG